jgi:hypothetical protein
MIYNKKLNISDNDIVALQDVDSVLAVKRVLDLEMAEFDMRSCNFDKLNEKQRKVRTSLSILARLCNSKLLELSAMHLNSLTIDEIRNMQFYVRFAHEAKELLSEKEYKRIASVARYGRSYIAKPEEF